MNQKIQSFLSQAKKTFKNSTDLKNKFSVFQKSLLLYENKKYKEALNLCTRFLATSTDEEEKLLCYRLWVDILASTKDHLSLQSLSNHLLKISQSEHTKERKDDYLGLRGLVHLERDEFEACKLLTKQKHKSKSTFYQEFRYRFSIHQKEEHQWKIYPLMNIKLNAFSLKNVFYWHTLLESMIHKKLAASALTAINFIEKIYPGNQKTSTAAAVLYSQMSLNKKRVFLKNKFLNHKTYPLVAFARASSLVFEGKHEEALKIFDYLEKKKFSHQNIFFQIGLCLEAKFRKQHEPQLLKDAKTSYQKSLHYQKQRNLPLAQSLFAINRLSTLHYLAEGKEQGTKTKSSTRQPKCWVIHLSPKQYHEASSFKEQDISNLFPSVPKSLKKGDVVLYVGTSTHWRNSCRLIAIYTASTNSFFDPISGYQSHLSLDAKLEFPMEINENELAPLNLKTLKEKGYASINEEQLKKIKNLIDEDRQHVSVFSVEKIKRRVGES